MYEEFKGRVAIVTGGATGMGKGAALALAKLGVKVVVATGSNVDGANRTVEEIRSAGGEAIFVRCDVSNEADVANLVAKTVETFGRLDLAFNNAGVGPDGVRLQFAPLVDLEEPVWDKVMGTNAKGVFLCVKHEVRQMLKQGGKGVIVNTASIGGLRMVPTFGAYGPSKAAVIAITQLAAAEYAGQGIRVNVVCPGPTLGTELMKNSMSTGSAAAVETEGGAGGGPHIPLGKMGEVDDVVNAVIWLMSAASGHITGHALPIDGGMTEVG
ncbi:MAG: glucose 1-dehydrogenase [Lachnospiraceae bacterium]|jgi:NAD(P)-dependent dehydrogenase (short-subunit alcohol dehydrogenase family)|nr:glucose 1-dehydrogenase [Lachnospiraceae bacterium]